MTNAPSTEPAAPPSPEQLAVAKFSQAAQTAGQFAQQMQSWVSSAINCLELGDAAGFKRHIDIAEGYTANLASMMAAQVGWKDMLERMKAAGSRPAVSLMLANVSKGTGSVNGATWWGGLDAAAAFGKMGVPDATPMVCVVIPVSHNPAEGGGPKLTIAS